MTNIANSKIKQALFHSTPQKNVLEQLKMLTFAREFHNHLILKWKQVN